ncbi:MAG: radical SAM protein [bacterium]|nr:radical SAM protein [bacterium]
MSHSFELGPIRPPSEAYSILLRVTRNCPWNKCAFCPVYKGQKFSLRTVEEIKSDIDSIHYVAGKILQKSGDSAMIEEGIPGNIIQQVSFWLSTGMKSLFLQDADSLVMKTDALVEILNYIREKFPTIERITSYSRAKTVSRKSLEELKAIRQAGLDRLHIGMESGSDEVLKLINKGVSEEEQVDAGQKAIEAGFELSEYFMPGSGGEELSRENALGTAGVLNRVNPTFIRIRSTIPIPGTPLHEMMTEKKWTPVTEINKIKEIRLMIENLEGITSIIKSDHIMNLLEDVEGTLPADKQKMIDFLDKFLDMPVDDQESFIVGRRIGRFRFLSDFRNDPEVEGIKNQLKSSYSSLDEAMMEVARNYM